MTIAVTANLGTPVISVNVKLTSATIIHAKMVEYAMFVQLAVDLVGWKCEFVLAPLVFMENTVTTRAPLVRKILAKTVDRA